MAHAERSLLLQPVKVNDNLLCSTPTYITKFNVTSGIVDGATRVTNISALCSDGSTTNTVSIPESCPLLKATSSGVLSDSNPPAWCVSSSLQLAS